MSLPLLSSAIRHVVLPLGSGPAAFGLTTVVSLHPWGTLYLLGVQRRYDSNADHRLRSLGEQNQRQEDAEGTMGWSQNQNVTHKS